MEAPLASPTDAKIDLKSELRSIVAGTIGGARYGVKIRLPHALLMTMLFQKRATLAQKVRKIISLTANHSGHLIASILVNGSMSSRRLDQRPPGFPERTQHAAIAGAVGGYLIWGRYNSLNNQVLLYLTGRVIVGLTSLAREKGIPPFGWDMMKFSNVYPVKVAAIWAAVMVMFEKYPHVLHPSLKNSMVEIYRYIPEGWKKEEIEDKRS